jgi:hypothetical protein
MIGQHTKQNGQVEWTFVPESEDGNRARYNPHKLDIQARWVERHPKAGAEVPGSDHDPIIFDEGDTLQFFNNTDDVIGIGLHKNGDVDEFPGSPDVPLVNWPGVQTVQPGQRLDVSVMTGGATPGTPGPKEQGFYKFHGWLKVKGAFVSIDPDGYCGG